MPHVLSHQLGGGHDHSFTLQAIMEQQKAIGQLTESVNNLNKSITELAGKIEKDDEKLSGVTHKIYAAGVVLAIVLVCGGFIVNKAWDMMAVQIISNVK
jgi:hypothetical protein